MKKCLAVLALSVLVAACGSNVAYAPAAWGSPGYCYYLVSPYECYGHHPGVPVVMPLWWHERYANYYDSPAYVGTYVPRSYRSTATSRARSFERTYRSQINRASRYATWRGSNGKTVSGTKVSRSSAFGSGGGARSTGGSGGSLRRSSGGNPCAAVHEARPYLVAATVFVRGGSFSGGARVSSGSSFGSGGSARGGLGVGSGGGRRSGTNC